MCISGGSGTDCALNEMSIRIGRGALGGHSSKPFRSHGETCDCEYSVVAQIVAVEMCISGGSSTDCALNETSIRIGRVALGWH